MSDNENRDRTIVVTEKVRLEENGSTYEPYLIQISGRETGQMYNLKGRNVKLGRDPSCQIPLDDPHVSRNHAEIIWRNGTELVIRDVGSTNGIFVNGKKVQEQVLLDGDKILIGTRLYFKFCYQDSVDQSYQQNLFRAANIDGLTQLYNKKYFVDVLSKEFSFAKRNKTPLSLMMIDVDHFKKINDTHGHIAGDLVLKHIGQYLHKSLRLENIACRYGGEEFAIILRNVDATTAMQIAERVRLNVEKQPVTYRNDNIFITISLGVATLDNGNFETIEDFIRAADECLYAAKQGGRNRTVMREAA
ncbi:MAG: GGDEF domain-containing protein [Bdellovibrionales bacterium]|nr:GGDEF domain-containing protein [Bdellovibrionales bacterium]